MKQLLDTVWQRRGTSWIWDEEARNQVCVASEVWSLRQFLQAVGAEDDPASGGRQMPGHYGDHRLNLANTVVTAAGVEKLAGLGRLQSVNLAGTRASR